jgi:3-hydroxy-9,10-secoandrosta-1,3,5(10)-triene-9,17-dione monooxygenase
MVVLKRGEYTIKDVWFAPGMKATGSNNVVVEDVFIPAGRATRIGDLNSKASTGQTLNDGWTYRLPMLQVFAYSIVGPIIGCARGGLDAFLEQMSTRKAHDGTRMADLQSLQLRIAESSAEIDAAEALYRSDIAFANNLAKTNGDLTPLHIARIARNCGFIANLCRRAGLRLVEALGATGTEDSNPVQRAFDDTVAGAAHRSLGWDLSASNYGKLLLSAK